MKTLMIFCVLFMIISCNDQQSKTNTNQVEDHQKVTRKGEEKFYHYDYLNSFKGIKFGSPKNEVWSILGLKDSSNPMGVMHIITNSDYLKFCGHQFPVGIVSFFEDQFCYVVYDFDPIKNSSNSFDYVFNDLTALLGESSSNYILDSIDSKDPPHSTTFKYASWTGKNIKIFLSADLHYNQFSLEIKNIGLVNLRDAKMKNQEAINRNKSEIPSM